MSIEDLLNSQEVWKTSVGLSFPGEKVVFRGKDLFDECADKSWMELLLLGITGREFSKEQLKLFNAIWVICTSYPDPRIWNNRISAIAGSSRSTASLANAASVAASEATIYGMRPIVKSFDFLYKTNIEIDKGESIEDIVKIELKKYRKISGYARPIVNQDERIKPLVDLANQLGLAEGAHLKLAFSVEKTLLKLGYKMNANIASIAAGLCLDQGFSLREYYYYLVYCFSIGFITCYLDASNKKEGTLFPLGCNNINYSGLDARKW